LQVGKAVRVGVLIRRLGRVLAIPTSLGARFSPIRASRSRFIFTQLRCKNRLVKTCKIYIKTPSTECNPKEFFTSNARKNSSSWYI